VHAELRLGLELHCSRKRVERLMRQVGLAGIHRRRRGGCTRRDATATSADDLVNRAFDPTEPDRLWMMDITEHPTSEGKVYLAVVVDGFSRMVVGWSIADHVRAELVVDALQMANWRRRPTAGHTVAHSDHGSQYTSWAFGRRLRAAGLLGSMGSVGDCFDNSVVESFFGTLQLELLDEHQWSTRQQLALAVFEWIEAWYNPRRRHSYCKMLSPVDYEAACRPRPKQPHDRRRGAKPGRSEARGGPRRRQVVPTHRANRASATRPSSHTRSVRAAGGSSTVSSVFDAPALEADRPHHRWDRPCS